MRFTLLESWNGNACMLNVLNLWIITYAVFPCSVYYRILFLPMDANGCLQKQFNFYSFPISLGRVSFVLVLTSTNHNARNWYPEIVMARTVGSLNMITTSLLILSSFLSNSATSHVKLSVFVHQLSNVTAVVKTVTNLNSFNWFNVNVQSNSLIFSHIFRS